MPWETERGRPACGLAWEVLSKQRPQSIFLSSAAQPWKHLAPYIPGCPKESKKQVQAGHEQPLCMMTCALSSKALWAVPRGLCRVQVSGLAGRGVCPLTPAPFSKHSLCKTRVILSHNCPHSRAALPLSTSLASMSSYRVPGTGLPWGVTARADRPLPLRWEAGTLASAS